MGNSLNYVNPKYNDLDTQELIDLLIYMARTMRIDSQNDYNHAALMDAAANKIDEFWTENTRLHYC